MTKPRKRSKPSAVFPPSLVFLLLTLVSIAGELVEPLPLLPGNLVRMVSGTALMLIGAGLWIAAWLELRRNGEVFGHQYTTDTVVTSGPYRISRHPAYLAYALAMLGAGLLMDNVWTLLLTPLAVLIADGAARREETYLMAKHENRYRPYRSEVRRWI